MFILNTQNGYHSVKLQNNSAGEMDCRLAQLRNQILNDECCELMIAVAVYYNMGHTVAEIDSDWAHCLLNSNEFCLGRMNKRHIIK